MRSSRSRAHDSHDALATYGALQTLITYFSTDNVTTSAITDDIKRFVTGLSVRVISCFEVKPRRSNWQRQTNTMPDRKAFRLCVNRDDCDKLLFADRWPSDITVSAWRFKAKAVGDTGNVQTGQLSVGHTVDVFSSVGVVTGYPGTHDVTEVTDMADADVTALYDPVADHFS
jgi:hypothetical protein